MHSIKWAMIGTLMLTVAAGATACNEPLSERDRERLGTLAALEVPPPSPTNAVADDPDAARFGQAIFFDRNMSADGQISCASCHDPQNGFSDRSPLSEGVEGRVGNRHAPTLLGSAYGEFFFWDGRADSLWSAPLQAIEAEFEGDFTRTEVVHLMADRHRESYEAIFGPLPDTDALPERAKPGDPAWEALSEDQQRDINTAFANVGKALEAYQRLLVCNDTKFDRVMAGQATFTPEEEAGARQFVRGDEGNCIACHGGPNFTDNDFHRLDLPRDDDPGRFAGIESLLENPFNGAGDFSDDSDAGFEKISVVEDIEDALRGQFKTPTLRGVTQRRSLGHLGHAKDLDEWFDTVYDRGGNGGRGRGDGRRGNNDIDPEARGLQFNDREMEAFLSTLACPPLPQELLGPPDGL